MNKHASARICGYMNPRFPNESWDVYVGQSEIARLAAESIERAQSAAKAEN
jgi:hypothetical protein